MATTLDGYIARKDGGVDWCFTEEDCGYSKFIKTIDTLIIGRKAYDVTLKFGDWAWKDKKCIVFSRKKRKNNDIVSFEKNPIKIVKKLKKENGKNIWLFGGGVLNSTLLKAGLIDEVHVYVHPIVLGDGLPLFPGIKKEVKMKLIFSKMFGNGLMGLHYRI